MADAGRILELLLKRLYEKKPVNIRRLDLGKRIFLFD